MHNRKKSTKPPSDEEKAAAEAKVAKYRKLSGMLLQTRAALRTSDDPDPANGLAVAAKQIEGKVLTLQAQLLRVNPDLYTIWNHRKELLLCQLSSATAVTSSSFPPQPLEPATLQEELGLTTDCIRKQPKSYR